MEDDNITGERALMIRNSTAEFLIFTKQAGQESIEVKIEDNTVWLTQELIARLYDKGRSTIAEHLLALFRDKELDEKSVCRNFRRTADDGKQYDTKFYNLSAIIAIGFKVSSERAIQFRQWAARILHDFTIQGYVLDKERLKNGVLLDDDYYEKLLEDIREIRLSERRFYQKVTDIYATSIDYDKDSEATILFYKTVQNKLHWAIHGHTAAEIIHKRADHKKDYMGLTTWEKSPHGKIRKSDVVIAKNYLSDKELDSLKKIVSAYLEFAEFQASRHIPMTMRDWVGLLNSFLQASRVDILNNAGKISAEIAKAHAETEFEKYRPIQDKLFESDFDKMFKQTSGEIDAIESTAKKNKPRKPY